MFHYQILVKEVFREKVQNYTSHVFLEIMASINDKMLIFWRLSSVESRATILARPIISIIIYSCNEPIYRQRRYGYSPHTHKNYCNAKILQYSYSIKKLSFWLFTLKPTPVRGDFMLMIPTCFRGEYPMQIYREIQWGEGECNVSMMFSATTANITKCQ